MKKQFHFKKIFQLLRCIGMATVMFNACSDESFWKIEPETDFTVVWQTPDGQVSPPPCPATLTNTTNTRGLVTTYDWTINGAHIATSKDATYTFDASESYTIKLTATNRNTSQSKENIVAIPEMKVSGITISPSGDVSVEAGKTITLTATVTPADAANKTITWNSLNTDIATVIAQSGVVTGISAGTATIRATASDGSGVTANKNVTVTPEVIKVTGITISPSSTVTVEAGKTTTLTATVTPSNANNRSVTWNSLNTGIATVNAQSGVVTGVSAGTATIRATAADGSGITANKSVIVTPIPNLSVSPTSYNFTASGGTSSTITVTSNQSWTVSSNASWLTTSRTNGSNNNTFTMTASANTSTSSSRSAIVTVAGGGITKTVSVTQDKKNTEPEMVLVQDGTFRMGCTSEQGSDCWSDETPTHNVTLSSFYIGKYPVTQTQWQAIMGSNPSYLKGDNLPVEQVSWNDIVGTSGNYTTLNGIRYYENGFIYKLNAATGKKYRLPTEAEWEFAARGGNKSQGYKYSGSNSIGNVAWYFGNSGSTTHAVGTKQANELGIYDMSGNVYEWCQDWYGSYISSAQTNPTGPSTGSIRVIRGGSWYGDAQSCRVSYRGNDGPDSHGSSVGFRVALSL